MWTRKRMVVAASSSAGVLAAGLAAGLLLIPGEPPLPPPKPVAATPTPTPTRLLSPFTGEPVRSLRTVLAVKIDNIVLARPVSVTGPGEHGTRRRDAAL